MLDYKLLEALSCVVTEGGFERAARVLHLTQSAVSQRVRLLEEQTGQILVARSTPPVPTPAGRQLLKHYRQVRILEGDLNMDANQEGSSDNGFNQTVAVAVNADSLATWFLPAVQPFIQEHQVLLDLCVDDQDETHKLLKDGDVVGCVSARSEPMQGCRVEVLGGMEYRLVATPEFARRWFPHGLTVEAVRRAPAVTFNRVDESINVILRNVFGHLPGAYPTHYVPSSEQFVTAIAGGWGYGTLPEQQSTELLATEKLVDLAPVHPMPVTLHWHCWNLDSPLLAELTRALVRGASAMLSGKLAH
ncbi:LysR family transcriptional regulator ArgP [Desulfovibrio ferrophilus]|uniref:Transcriptional regulator, ArgP, LysR family n=1 Tax=Desulfovibrio ferrophilus TaxID=241368 RepID=A0A2Z6B166_9BACT|nr:LysR family transcriptional regulator ArgP [Desulfovibrio ferrophilus]BBD09224.1 transcriptional regulator, ArgP, LysR family [Desulfovibrio ferrophilus]